MKLIHFEFKQIHWWYWLVSWALVVMGLSGHSWAFYAATGLAAFQIGHYRLSEGSFTAFPVQVRVTVFLIFLLGLVFSAVYWLPAFGLFARIVFNYCLTARVLRLLPWNRGGEPLSRELIRRVIFSSPVSGPVK